MGVRFVDELEAEIAESMKSFEYREAREDLDARNELIARLVHLRVESGLTQKEVAQRMGVKQPMVSGFENGGADPRLSTLQRYARAVCARLVTDLDMPPVSAWKPRARVDFRYATDQVLVEVKVEASPVSVEDAVAWRAARSRREDFGLAS